jgi:phosphate transport system protein
VTSDSSTELEQLKERLLVMGGAVEEQLRLAIQSLVERDHQLAQEVLRADAPINQMHMEIDGRCFQLLTVHQPEAVDLRMVMSSVKINKDLERVGDFAVNIGEATIRYLDHPSVKPLIDIPQMATIAQGMLRDSLNAFVGKDLVLAQAVRERDDSLDQLRDRVFRDLIGVMCSEQAVTERALDLLLISRHLERVGDHATNIAEETIFIVSGLDVRHHGQEGQE